MSAPARDPRLAAIRQRLEDSHLWIARGDLKADLSWLLARVEALENAATAVATALAAWDDPSNTRAPLFREADVWRAARQAAALAPPPGGTPCASRLVRTWRPAELWAS